MSEQDSAQEGTQAGATSNAAATNTTNQTTDTAATQDGAEEFDKPRAMATIQKLREAEKAGRAAMKELADLRAAQKQAEDAKLSESERLTSRLGELERTVAQQKADAEQKIADAEAKRLELEAELASERRASRVAKIASTLGAHDPHDANILAATSGVDATAADAEAKISAAIAELKKARPYLFKATGGRLETFNPGNDANGVAETDVQKVARLRSQTQSGKGLFG